LIAIKQKVLRRLEAQPSILEIQHWLFIPNRERELPKIKSVPRSVALAWKEGLASGSKEVPLYWQMGAAYRTSFYGFIADE
jgi:hypothetical protein